jgi:glycosyltransferase involved in cell wall biosynthesis/2-polyprenyl-3-methyl-5-hydroxy-6-metoxy-1,4-benzoquinol methylase
MIQLENLGYDFDSTFNIWKREDYTNIGYNDGDFAENRLADIVRNTSDVSIFSTELRNQCIDWQTLYHLSSQRGNVLRPFAHLLKGDVLEIGAGCGAISRFLGENGGNILALEGSQRRAAIAASRTRDLDNVQVLAERFDKFVPNQQFDAITLIGVLEYATMFGEGDNPEIELLTQIRKLLKPGGFLFIAIENKLGLKYFAGAPEDHINVPMYGIEGRYKSGEAKTWGYAEIEKLLQNTGYTHTDFLFPFPDYKLPASILTSKGSLTPEFDAAAFAVQSVFSDPQLPPDLTFSLQQSFPEVFNNNLGKDLANSFIIAASPDASIFRDESILAWHYSTQRKKEYAKETIFSLNQNREINISYHYFAEQQEIDDNADYKHVRKMHDDYYHGQCLSHKFASLLATKNWTLNELYGLIKQWIGAIEGFISTDHANYLPFVVSADYSLPGEFIDAVPQNIILNETGSVLFDVEWSGNKNIELGHLLFRGLVLTINQTRVQVLNANSIITRHDFIKKCFSGVGIDLTDDDLSRYVRMEAEYQCQVTGRSIGELMDWQENKPLSLIKSKVQTSSQLYYAADDNELNENNTLSTELQAGKNKLRWQVKTLAGQKFISELRFDPVNIHCWFIVHSLTVRDLQGKPIWQLEDSKQPAMYHDILLIKGEDQADICYSFSDDPHIYLAGIPPLSALTIDVEIEIIDKERLDDAFLAVENQRLLLNNQLKVAESELQNNSLRFIENAASIARKNEKLSAAQEQLSAAQEQFSAAQDQLSAVNEQLSTVNGHLNAANQSLAELRMRIHALETSTSWKITAPLRFVGSAKRKTVALASVANRLYRTHGAKKILRRGFEALRREGLRGVIARLRQQRVLQLMQTGSVVSSHALNATVSYDQQQGYRLKQGGNEYCYIPPAAPDNLSLVLDNMAVKPYFSIVVPVYNTPLQLLDELVKSVEAQWYPRWELILANDCSTDKALDEALLKINHPQIRVINLEKNSGISGATNAAIEQAAGDYIVFTDHDDVLTSDCLFELAVCINHQDPDFIYSDEDKLSEDGRFVQPHFKPDWSPDTMMSTMYTCHVSCVKKVLLDKTGLLRSEFDGCQDWDFVLRVAEQTSKISHIPKVLYHWRIIPQSIASNIAAKDYVLKASQNVRKEALLRRGEKGDVESVEGYPGYFRVNYLPLNNPLVSIIIPTRDNYAVLRRCLDSVANITAYKHYEIVILDNGSVDPEALGYLKEINAKDNVKVIRHDHPFNFSELNNVGVAQSSGDVLLFLNDDTEVIQGDWLERLVGFAQLPHVGAVGAKLLYPESKRVQHAGIVNLADGPGHAFLNTERDMPGYFMRNVLDYNWLAVTGACLMIERDKFERIGRFDESFPVAYNDIELCFRSVDAGYQNVVCQAVELYHHESVSRGVDHLDNAKAQRLHNEKRRLYEKYPHYYQYDPYFNINLHPNGINFEMGQ